MSDIAKKSQSFNWIMLTGLALLLSVALWLGIRIIFPDRPTLLAGATPTNLGVTAQQLASCPSTPNCVSSQSRDAEHHIEPLTYNSTPTEAIEELKDIIASQPRAQLVTTEDNYLYAQFTSKWMGFVDDVEFYLNQDANTIEVRSASRLGESDLGVNRQRIESIREQFH